MHSEGTGLIDKGIHAYDGEQDPVDGRVHHKECREGIGGVGAKSQAFKKASVHVAPLALLTRVNAVASY